MSVIVAIKENGVVYMGADSQTTTGRRKRNGLNETAFKITRLENGMLVGFCGRVAAKQAVPKLVDKMQLIGDEDSGALDVCILLAYKDKLYRITSGLDVVKLTECGRSGAGADFTNWYLFGEKNLPVRERILKALVASAKRTESVGGPYVLIDTKSQEFEVVDMGGDNH